MIIIPARLESTRFPNKPLALINGKEMILHVYEKCATIEDTWVATPNVELYQLMLSRGYQAVLTSEQPTGTDRVAEAIAFLNDEQDIYINVQGDAPAIDTLDIIDVILEKKKHPNHVIGTMCKLRHNNQNVVKVIQNAGQLCYMTRKGESRYKQCGLYAFNSAELTMFYNMPKKEEMLRRHENIEIMRFVEMGYPVQMVEIEGGPEVDVPEDIAIVEQYLLQKVGG